ncbi:MAG TPA: sigma-70 family RNA polymerase sigma factor [Edaphocola sp.]|nr:sigma-70 family RNA polymerase sigma factor [Edaphocola sp.]
MSTVSYRNLLDEELLYRMAQRSDQEAMNMLYRRYAHLALGLALKYVAFGEAQSIVQHVFAHVWNEASSLKMRSFKSWLYNAVKMECVSRLGAPPAGESAQGPVDLMEAENLNMLNMEQEHMVIMLEDCLSSLPSEQRICIELFYKGQKTYEEIASQQRMTAMQVKTLLQAGRKNLKICFRRQKNAH